MAALQAAFSNAVEGLNTTFNGEYLFAGGQVNTQPVSATSLSDLTANPISEPVPQRPARRPRPSSTRTPAVSTGFLASNVGTPLFQALAAIEAYNQGPTVRSAAP